MGEKEKQKEIEDLKFRISLLESESAGNNWFLLNLKSRIDRLFTFTITISIIFFFICLEIRKLFL